MSSARFLQEPVVKTLEPHPPVPARRGGAVKAITLHQPWASLIAAGIKTIETRSWAPPRRLIGQRIAIHASRKREVSGKLHPETLLAVLDLFGHGWSDRIPLGAVVATALLKDARQVGFQRYVGRVLASSPSYTGWIEPDPYGDFSVGRWLWILTDIQKVEPLVPARGRQGLWDWCPDMEEYQHARGKAL